MRGLRVLPGSEVELRAVMRTHGPLISRIHLPGLGLTRNTAKKRQPRRANQLMHAHSSGPEVPARRRHRRSRCIFMCVFSKPGLPYPSMPVCMFRFPSPIGGAGPGAQGRGRGGLGLKAVKIWDLVEPQSPSTN